MFRFPFSVLRFSVIACAPLGLMGWCFFFTGRCPMLVQIQMYETRMLSQKLIIFGKIFSDETDGLYCNNREK